MQWFNGSTGLQVHGGAFTPGQDQMGFFNASGEVIMDKYQIFE